MKKKDKEGAKSEIGSMSKCMVWMTYRNSQMNKTNNQSMEPKGHHRMSPHLI